jgi:hypothetical protein
MANIGVITEQGDLGLGFDEVSVQEQEKMDKVNNIKEETNMAPDKTSK